MHRAPKQTKKGAQALFIDHGCFSQARCCLAVDTVAGSYDKAKFVQFLDDLLLPELLGKSLVLMDNVQPHRSKEVKPFFQQHACSPIYRPPHYPHATHEEAAARSASSKPRAFQSSSRNELPNAPK
jgi:hypothetical protein